MQTIRHLLVEGDGERSDVDLHGACIRHANQQISAHELLGGSIPIGDVAELGHNRGRHQRGAIVETGQQLPLRVVERGSSEDINHQAAVVVAMVEAAVRMARAGQRVAPYEAKPRSIKQAYGMNFSDFDDTEPIPRTITARSSYREHFATNDAAGVGRCAYVWSSETRRPAMP